MDSLIGRATSRSPPNDNWSAAVYDGLPWSGGSATPGNGCASLRDALPVWPSIRLCRDGTKYHAVKLNVS